MCGRGRAQRKRKSTPRYAEALASRQRATRTATASPSSSSASSQGLANATEALEPQALDTSEPPTMLSEFARYADATQATLALLQNEAKAAKVAQTDLSNRLDHLASQHEETRRLLLQMSHSVPTHSNSSSSGPASSSGEQGMQQQAAPLLGSTANQLMAGFPVRAATCTAPGWDATSSAAPTINAAAFGMVPPTKSPLEISMTPLSPNWNIKTETKADISMGKYVCFRALLRQLKRQEEPEAGFIQEKGGYLRLIPEKKSDPLSFTSWGVCWTAFTTELFEARRDPSLVAKLALHEEKVRDLMIKGQDWHFYDEGFRLAVERGEAHWGYPKWDLYFAAASRQTQSKKDGKKGGTSKSGGKSWFPSRRAEQPCHEYQRSGSCSRGDACAYSHKCSHCNGSHASSNCIKKQSTQAALPFQSGPSAAGGNRVWRRVAEGQNRGGQGQRGGFRK